MLGSAPGAPSKTTRLSKGLAALLVAVYVVQYYTPITVDYLALVPGRTLPCVWNVVTAGFLTTNLFEVVIEALALLLLARLVEPYYGTREFLLFIVVVNVATCCATFLTIVAWFAITRDAVFLYLKFSGFHGILFGLLVALKHVMPELEFKLAVVSVKAKYVPSIAVILAIGICWALKQHSFLSFALWGTYVAWLYLRFFQRQADSNLKGDASEDFRFASFFPAFLAAPVDVVAAVFSMVFRLKHDSSAHTKSTGASSSSLLGSDPSDASRRRERGARALEERLGQKKSATGDLETAAADLPSLGSAAQFYAGAVAPSK